MIMAILPKLGYNRNMPREVVFGPYNQGGIGLAGLYVTAGTAHVMTALRQTRMNTGQLANVLKIAKEWAQKHTGNEHRLFNDVTTDLPHLPDGWIKYTREFLKQSNSRLHYTFPTMMEKLRLNDRIIMEDVKRSPFLSATDKEEVNFCRLYLNAETLSDICTIEGLDLNKECFNAQNPNMECTSQTLWPKQGKPGQEQWNKFRAFARKTYCVDQYSFKLRMRLGKWITQGKTRNWNCYYNPETNTVSVKEDDTNEWEQYNVNRTGIHDRFEPVGNAIHTESQSTDKGQPSFIQEQKDTSWKCWVSQDPTPPLSVEKKAKPKTFKQYLPTIPLRERELLADSDCMDGTDGASLAALLKDYKQGNNLVGASDGGLRKIKRE
jgi:hypothetical protein